MTNNNKNDSTANFGRETKVVLANGSMSFKQFEGYLERCAMRLPKVQSQYLTSWQETRLGRLHGRPPGHPFYSTQPIEAIAV